MALASLDDYAARFGAPDDEATVAQLIEDASALVCQITDQTISWVDNDTQTVETGGDSIAFLPELPVTAVSVVKVDGVTLDPSTYEAQSYGMLTRFDGIWPNRARAVEVTYDHGYLMIPSWIVNLVCIMAQRVGSNPGAPGPVKSESFVDAYSVTYQDSSSSETTGQVIGVTGDEKRLLQTLNMAKAIA